VNAGLRFLVQDTKNTIREEIVEVTNDTRYLQQELLMDPNSQACSNRRTRVSLIKAADDTVEEKPVSPVAQRTPLSTILSNASIHQSFKKYSDGLAVPTLVVSLKEAV